MADSQPTSVVETWKPVVGYEGFYEVSSFGNVRSCERVSVENHLGGPCEIRRRSRPMRQYAMPTGHRALRFSRHGKTKLVLVHRLVLEAFVGPCPEGAEACHNDGSPANNRPDNLRWDTRKANVEDARKHGTLVEGERSGASKLTADDVRRIRRMRGRGLSYAHIGHLFGVADSTISNIYNGHTWRSVPA